MRAAFWAASTLSFAALAQQAAPTKPALTAPSAVAAAPKEAKPSWQELTPAQQQALKPLNAKWPTIGEAQKRKWLEVSKNYPSLPVPEQAKLHSRMTEWVALSPQQRLEARMNFAETKTLSANEKAATWAAYQALSPEEKRKLAAQAPPKPMGATAAVKPVAPQKLATVPVTRRDTKVASDASANADAVGQNTLLPRPPAVVEPAPVLKN